MGNNMKRIKVNSFTNKGQAIIEFVFISVLVVVILYGIVDLVRLGVIKHVLDSACREGVRTAATIPNLATDNPIVISRVNKVLMDSNMMSKMGLNTPEIIIENNKTTAEKGDIIVVTVSGDYMNMFAIITGAKKTISGKATSKYLI